MVDKKSDKFRQRGVKQKREKELMVITIAGLGLLSATNLHSVYADSNKVSLQPNKVSIHSKYNVNDDSQKQEKTSSLGNHISTSNNHSDKQDVTVSNNKQDSNDNDTAMTNATKSKSSNDKSTSNELKNAVVEKSSNSTLSTENSKSLVEKQSLNSHSDTNKQLSYSTNENSNNTGTRNKYKQMSLKLDDSLSKKSTSSVNETPSTQIVVQIMGNDTHTYHPYVVSGNDGDIVNLPNGQRVKISGNQLLNPDNNQPYPVQSTGNNVDDPQYTFDQGFTPSYGQYTVNYRLKFVDPNNQSMDESYRTNGTKDGYLPISTVIHGYDGEPMRLYYRDQFNSNYDGYTAQPIKNQVDANGPYLLAYYGHGVLNNNDTIIMKNNPSKVNIQYYTNNGVQQTFDGGTYQRNDKFQPFDVKTPFNDYKNNHNVDLAKYFNLPSDSDINSYIDQAQSNSQNSLSYTVKIPLTPKPITENIPVLVRSTDGRTTYHATVTFNGYYGEQTSTTAYDYNLHFNDLNHNPMQDVNHPVRFLGNGTTLWATLGINHNNNYGDNNYIWKEDNNNNLTWDNAGTSNDIPVLKFYALDPGNTISIPLTTYNFRFWGPSNPDGINYHDDPDYNYQYDPYNSSNLWSVGQDNGHGAVNYRTYNWVLTQDHFAPINTIYSQGPWKYSGFNGDAQSNLDSYFYIEFTRNGPKRLRVSSDKWGDKILQANNGTAGGRRPVVLQGFIDHIPGATPATDENGLNGYTIPRNRFGYSSSDNRFYPNGSSVLSEYYSGDPLVYHEGNYYYGDDTNFQHPIQFDEAKNQPVAKRESNGDYSYCIGDINNYAMEHQINLQYLNSDITDGSTVGVQIPNKFTNVLPNAGLIGEHTITAYTEDRIYYDASNRAFYLTRYGHDNNYGQNPSDISAQTIKLYSVPDTGSSLVYDSNNQRLYADNNYAQDQSQIGGFNVASWITGNDLPISVANTEMHPYGPDGTDNVAAVYLKHDPNDKNMIKVNIPYVNLTNGKQVYYQSAILPYNPKDISSFDIKKYLPFKKDNDGTLILPNSYKLKGFDKFSYVISNQVSKDNSGNFLTDYIYLLPFDPNDEANANADYPLDVHFVDINGNTIDNGAHDTVAQGKSGTTLANIINQSSNIDMTNTRTRAQAISKWLQTKGLQSWNYEKSGYVESGSSLDNFDSQYAANHSLQDLLNNNNLFKNVYNVYVVLNNKQNTPENATVEYVDDTDNRVLFSQHLSGNYGTNSDYRPDAMIAQYEKEGYKINVTPDYPSDGNIFDQDGVNQKFIIHLTHNIISQNVNKTVHENINYVDAKGNSLHTSISDQITFTGTVNIDEVNNNVINYNLNHDSVNFTAKNSPVIEGYVLDNKQQTTVTGPAVTLNTSDINVNVVYDKIGSLIPIDSQGNTIYSSQYDTQYPNDAKDPSVVNNPVLPDIPGETPIDENGNVMMTGQPYPIALNTPTADTKVTYINNDQSAKVIYVDKTNNKTIYTDVLKGAPNSPVRYSTITRIKSYEDAGYELVSDNYPSKDAQFGHDNQESEYEVDLIHATATTDDTNEGNTPVNDNGKKWPTFTGDNALVKTVTRTINYVDKANGQTVAKPVTQTVTFKRTARIDKVTGAYSFSDWTSDNDGQWSKVVSPDESKHGYQAASQAEVDDEQVSADSSDVNITVSYDHATATTGNESDGNSPVNDNGKKWPVFTDKDALEKTVTRTINYVDKANGQTVAKPVTQTVTFKRTATIDKVSGAYSFSDWTSDNDGQWSKVVSPDESKHGYQAASQAEVDDEQVSADSSDVNITVSYDHATATTGNESDGNSPVNDNGKKWPVFTDKDALEKTVTRTINYVDKTNGQTVADPVIQTVTFKRTATIDKVTGAYSFSDWTSDNDGQWSKVVSPDESKHGYQAASQAEVDVGNVSADSSDVNVTVSYDHATATTGNESDGNSPVNDNGKKWPAFTDKDALEKTVTRTINYVDKTNGQTIAQPVTQTVTFKRTARIDKVTGAYSFSDWTSDNDGQWSKVVSPDESKHGYQAASQAEVDVGNVSADSSDVNVTVSYDHATATTGNESDGNSPVNDNGKKWPAFTDKDALEKTVTRTINYVDKTNGQTIAQPVTQTVTFKRTARIDKVTGAYSFSDWTSDNDGQWSKVVSPDESKHGYQAASQAEVDAGNISADSSDVNVTVSYDHATATTGNESDGNSPVNDNGKKWPVFTDKDALEKTVTRTINYVDKTNGQTVADPVIQTVTFKRTATIDKVTGAYSFSDWTSDNGGQWSKVVSPDESKHGYQAASQAEVDAGNVSADSSDVNVTVSYDHATATTGNESDGNSPVNDNGKKWPAFTDKDALEKTVTRTINYVDKTNGQTIAQPVTQTVTFKRTARIDKVTGAYSFSDWTSDNDGQWSKVVSPDESKHGYQAASQTEVDGEQVNADSSNVNVTVSYDHATATTGNESDGSSPVNDNGKKWPAFTDKDALEKTVTRTINYVDKTNGQTIAQPVTQTVTFKRTATIDKVTGAYSFSGWTSDNGGQWSKVVSPDESKHGYQAASQAEVDAGNVSADSSDVNVTVSYDHATATTGNESDGNSPVNDNGKKWPAFTDKDALEKTVTRTINYVDKTNGQTIAQPVTQTVTFKRTARIDKVTGAYSFSDWTSDNGGQWSKVVSPDESKHGYQAASQAEVDAGNISADSSDVNVTVSYDHATATTENESDGNSPVNDNGKKWPAFTDKDALEKTVTRTINYVDKTNGQTIAQPVTQTVTFKRTARIDKVTGAYSFSDWTSDNDGQWSKVVSPDESKHGYQAASQAEVDVGNVSADSSDVNVTVSYDHATATTGNESDGNSPVNDNGKKWPAFTDKDALEKTVTRTINYVDKTNGQTIAQPVTQTVTFKRTARIDKVTGAYSFSDWTSDNGGQWSKVVSPDESKHGYQAASQAEVDAGNVSADSSDVNVTVSYDHATATTENESDGNSPVNDNGKKWPAFTDKDALEKTVTRTINYVDKTNGQTIAQPVTQTVTFKRTARIDKVTGAYSFSDWTSDNDGQWSKVVSPDESKHGYQAASQAEVDAGNVSADSSDVNVTVSYDHATATTGNESDGNSPVNDNGKKWPVFTDKDALEKTVTRTINYVDKTNGQTIAKPVTQTVTFKRTARIDKVTGAYSFSDWTSDNDGQWSKVVSPDESKHGYQAASQTEVDGEQVNADSSDVNVTVSYDHATATTGNESDGNSPVNDNGKKWPAFTDKDALEKTVTRTINYVDKTNGQTIAKPVTQTVTFKRTARIDKVTGAYSFSDWTSDNDGQWSKVVSPDESKHGYQAASQTEVDGEQVNADSSDVNVTVSYDHATATTGNESDGSSPVNDNGKKWPAFTDKDALEKTVTRTINYVDKTNGQTIAQPVTQTVTFKRTARIDKVTGAYSFSDWTSDNGGQWSKVVSPDESKHGYQAASQAEVDAGNVSADSSDVNVTVSYDHATATTGNESDGSSPVNDNGKKWPAFTDKDALEKTVTRTINYVDKTNGQTIAKPVTQTVTFKRTARIDKVTGAYSFSDWTSDNDGQWSKVVSPDESKHGYQAASQTEVDGEQVNADSSNVNVTVSYDHATATTGNESDGSSPVNDNGKKWPAFTDKDALEKTVTRTINYVDKENGQMLAKPVTQTVTFKRTATIDKVTGAYSFSDWTSDNDGQWSEVISPDENKLGYDSASQSVVRAKKLTVNSPDIMVNVEYDHGMAIDNDNPKIANTTVNDNGKKWPAFTGKDALEKTVTRTINYIDKENGQTIAKPVTQTVTFKRTATIDKVTGAYSFSGWTSDNDGKWSKVVSPDESKHGYQAASQAEVDAENVSVDSSDVNVTVSYDHATATTVNASDGNSPVNDNGKKWPAFTDKDALEKTVTRTINYVDKENGQTIAKPVTQTVTFKRTATIDKVTGAYSFSAWTSDNDGQWSNVVSPDKSASGYQAASQAVVGTEQVSADSSNANITVVYDHATATTVNESDGNSPVNDNGKKWPAFTGKDALEKTVTRTINYIDKENGQTIAKPVTQTVTFKRTATIDKVTGAYSFSAWTSDNDGLWDEIVSPDKSAFGYQTASQAAVGTEQVSADSQNANITVVYDHATATTVNASDGNSPVNDNGKKWPAFTGKDALEKTVTRTINYVDKENGQTIAKPVTQTVTFKRTATIDKVTGAYSFSAWTSDNDGLWDEIVSPDKSAFGYQTASQAAVGIEQVSADSSNANITVVYDHATATTVNASDGNSPVNDNGKKWPAFTGKDALEKTVTRTINYVDKENGQTIAKPVTQTVTFKRTATIDKVTGAYSFSAWTSDNDGQWSNVVSPDKSASGYQAASQAVVGTEQVSADSSNANITVVYDHATATTVNESDGNSPVNDNGKKWPAFTGKDALEKTVTRTINYIDKENGQTIAKPVTQTVTFKRTATIDKVTGAYSFSAWTSDNDGLWDEIVSPDKSAFGYQTASQAAVGTEQVSADSQNANITVVYDHATATTVNASDGNSPVNDNGKKWPAFTGKDALEKTVTRTINYVDKENGQTIAKPVTQTVTFKRTATIDKVTGAYSFSAWTSDNDGLWDEIVSPDKSAFGYQTASQAAVGIEQVSADSSNANITVVYDHATATTVNASDGNSPVNDNGKKWPAFTGKDALEKTVTRTINYVDKENGQTIAKPVTQTVTFKRTATIDKVTGAYSFSAWTSDNDGQWSNVVSPDKSAFGYQTASQAAVGTEQVSADSSNANITVVYDHATATTVNESDGNSPVNDNGKKWPAFTGKDALEKTVTRTINYIDKENGQTIAKPVTQTVTFKRTATIDKVTGAYSFSAWTSDNDGQWSNVVSPDKSAFGYQTASQAAVGTEQVSADSQNANITVVYDHATATTVNASDGNSPVNDNGKKWPAFTGEDALEKTVTRTINYVDKANGKTLSALVTQVVTFKRTATIDKVTGAYSFSAWTSDNGGQWSEVKSPDESKFGYQAASQAAVGTEQVSADSQNVNITVAYDHATATTANVLDSNSSVNNSRIMWPAFTGKDALEKTVTRIINYVDKENGQTIAKTVIQTVTFKRTATIDKVTGQYIFSAWTSDNGGQWNKIVSPDKSASGYQAASQAEIGTEKVSTDSTDSNVTVLYDHAMATTINASDGDSAINDNGKKWPIFTGDNALEKIVTRTINYVDNESDKILAKPVIQQLLFKRSVTVDKVTGKVISYSKWNPNTDVFSAKSSPVIEGYVLNDNNQNVVFGTIVNSDSNNQIVNVMYDRSGSLTPEKPGEHSGNTNTNVKPSDNKPGNSGNNAEKPGEHSGNTNANVKPSDNKPSDSGNNAEKPGEHSGNTNNNVKPSDNKPGNSGNNAEKPGEHSGNTNTNVKPSDNKPGNSGNNAEKPGEHSGNTNNNVKPSDNKPSDSGNNAEKPGEHSGNTNNNVKPSDNKPGDSGNNAEKPGEHSGNTNNNVKPSDNKPSDSGNNAEKPGEHSGNTNNNVKPSDNKPGDSGNNAEKPGEHSGNTNNNVKPSDNKPSDSGNNVEKPGEHSGNTNTNVKPSDNKPGNSGNNAEKPGEHSGNTNANVKPSDNKSVNSGNNAEEQKNHVINSNNQSRISNDKLPQTGESNNSGIRILGIIATSLSGLMISGYELLKKWHQHKSK